MTQADEARGAWQRRRIQSWREAGHLEAVLLSRAGVVLSCALLIVLLSLNALVFAGTTQTLLAQDRWVAHTQGVLAALNAARDTLTSAENAQRGYILYGDPADLRNYEAAARAIEPRLAQLRQLVADNAAEARRAAALLPLADAKLAALDQTIALRGLGQSAQAQDLVVRDRDQHLSAALQRIFDAMTRTELALLAGVLLTLQRLFARRARLADERARLLGEAQQARAAAEAALTLRNDFLLVAAHDLRTPLTTMLGQAQLLAVRLRDGQTLEPAHLTAQVEAFMRATKRLVATVNELNDMVVLEAGEQLELSLAPMDLGGLVRAVADEMAPRLSAQGLEVVPVLIDAPDQHIVIRADRDRLARVLQNVIGNAIKYSVQGTPVSVEVRRMDEQAVVAVRDAGVGIPADDLPHIFERFYRAATARGIMGSGLGLAGAKASVEQHGGTIAVESAVGVGTTVTITLPLARRVAALHDPETAEVRGSSH